MQVKQPSLSDPTVFDFRKIFQKPRVARIGDY